MCEANVFLRSDGKEELLMESVDKIIPLGEELHLESIFGQQKIIKGRIVEMALVEHRIMLERI